MLRFIRSLSRDERGVSSLEYAVLGGIVVIALGLVGTYLSGTSSTTGLTGLFNTLLGSVTTNMAK
ncbi:Flp family type IVb pilin [Paraburkholderia silviterrae]|uniref:Flp family type IVb pilin n=1 Tax=Paraburkholderia silviterrae TaxID=2528715 RepID=A0A4R5M1E7_9BURK|nr:Flp family type IVb pilin [Paraburkholderia silviterrae]TDG19126.1 Flp family type IVb pilin [Paraburkholderia silviterrae]